MKKSEINYTSTFPTKQDVHFPDAAKNLACLFKALGHPARLKILRHLLAENRCICGRIVELLPLAQSTVSQHLKILKESGLILGEIEGPKTCYCVDRKKLASIHEALSALCNVEDENENTR
ncbi:MAG: metalloregulator ArsR/SmtB family transcription factor [Desulfobulbaceae bacterium]|nr:metalloregulator ArsR/SmtB family transcription factor [Desulfobulbaceae bacterium]